MAVTSPDQLSSQDRINQTDIIMVTTSDGITKKVEGAAINEFYVTCSTAAGTQKKVIKLTAYHGTTLPICAVFNVKFTNANTYGDQFASTKTNPTLEVQNASGTVIGTYNICDCYGNLAGKGFCKAGQRIYFKFTDSGRVQIMNSMIRQQSLGDSSGYTLFADGRVEQYKVVTVSSRAVGTKEGYSYYSSSFEITLPLTIDHVTGDDVQIISTSNGVDGIMKSSVVDSYYLYCGNSIAVVSPKVSRRQYGYMNLN